MISSLLIPHISKKHSNFLQTNNKLMQETIMKLEQENEYLTQELVASKTRLREDMDKVYIYIYVMHERAYSFI